MAPRRGAQKRQRSPTPDPDGMFQGMVVFMVPKGVQPRRLQVCIPPPPLCVLSLPFSMFWYSRIGQWRIYDLELGAPVVVFAVWKQKLTQMGAVVDDNVSKRVTHIFAMNSSTLLQQVNLEHLHRHKGVSFFFVLALFT
ncbi:hypothetical protein BHM03_00037772 [Ensete ventricosum]|nr:hypothetical protein BHM03_00037772 [Ensete ventricosum]